MSKVEERAERFRHALDAGPVFGGLGDLYAYEVEVDLEEEEPALADFQAPEDQTAVMPAVKLVERCTTAATPPLPPAPPSPVLPPPLPPAEQLRLFKLGVKRALERASLESFIPYVMMHGESYPAEPGSKVKP